MDAIPIVATEMIKTWKSNTLVCQRCLIEFRKLIQGGNSASAYQHYLIEV